MCYYISNITYINKTVGLHSALKSRRPLFVLLVQQLMCWIVHRCIECVPRIFDRRTDVSVGLCRVFPRLTTAQEFLAVAKSCIGTGGCDLCAVFVCSARFLMEVTPRGVATHRTGIHCWWSRSLARSILCAYHVSISWSSFGIFRLQ